MSTPNFQPRNEAIRACVDKLLATHPHWKYAIDDSNVKLLEDEQRITTLGKGKSISTAKAYPLKGILEHPEFEQYYPDLANKIKVKFYESQDKNEGGSIQNHSDGTYTIRTNAKFQEENGSVRAAAMETLRHEIQHVIQGLERSIKGIRISDVGGARDEHLYQLLKEES